MKTYLKMKDSEIIGIESIPEHWMSKPFKNCIDLIDGGVWGEEPSNNNSTIVLRSTEIGMQGSWNIKDPALRMLSTKEKKSSLLKKGDLLIVKSSGSENHLGKTALVTKEVEAMNCCFSNFIQRIRVDKNQEPSYWFFVMNGNSVKEQLKILGTTTTGLRNLTAQTFKSIFVPIPPILEQKNISLFLEKEILKIKIKLQKNQKLIQLLKEKNQSLINQTVTKGLDPTVPMKDSGKEMIGEIPEHWNISQLKRILKSGTSITYGILQPEENVSDGVPYIQTKDMKGDHLLENVYYKTSKKIAAQYKRSQVHVGDIIVAIRATVGKALMIPSYLDGANIDRGPAKITPNENVDSKYLLYCLNANFSQEYFKTQMKGATFKEITLDALRRHIIPLPPKKEQNQISKFLKNETLNINLLILKTESQITKLQEYRKSLITSAVTGKIDVREAVT